METFALAAAALAATTASLIGARRVAGHLAAFVLRQDRIDQALVTIDRELTNGDNGTLKSRVIRMDGRQVTQGAQLDQAQRDVSHVQDTLDEHLENLDMHNNDPRAHR